MASAVVFDVSPSKFVGSFVIGMAIGDAITYLQQSAKVIRRVDFIYNEAAPLEADLILNLVDEGMLLRFDGATQRLRAVEIFQFHRLTITYGAACFSSPHLPATFVKIYQLFGPTYPGTFDPINKEYNLHYPGISFVFPIPSKFEHLYLQSPQDIPLEFPDGTTPVLKRFSVYRIGSQPFSTSASHQEQAQSSQIAAPVTPSSQSGLSSFISSGSHFGAPASSSSSSSSSSSGRSPSISPSTSLYFEEVILSIEKGIHFTRRGKTIPFGATPQDVLTEIGRPSKIFHKDQDKLRIHALSAPSSLTQAEIVNNSTMGTPMARDYFFNYFSLGLDLVFDGALHVLKKVVAHTNFPGSTRFNIYTKCNFRVYYPSSASTSVASFSAASVAPSLPASLITPSASHVAVEAEKEQPSEAPFVVLQPDMRFDEVVELLGPAGRPLVNEMQSSLSPFGGTRFYGWKNVIVETLRNNFIASVTLFSDQLPKNS